MMASSSSSSGGRYKYDVFLSFRGEDTRKIFVGHLYKALEQKLIHTFIDSEKLEKGNKISELLTCIEGSRLSIVVLSQNYASSTWCLRELVKILDCMEGKKQMVLPIFYQVDPSDLRKITGKYAVALAKHGENPKLRKEEVESWKSAVNRVADLSGWDSSKYEDDRKLIEEIVAKSHRKLIHTSSDIANGLVGMDSHITEMMSKLCLRENDVRVVGIWGMGGLGKTTIARAVFDKIASQFEHSCFLGNVKEAFKNKLEVQKQEELLSRLLMGEMPSVGLDRGRNMIVERLGGKKVLVVLDDVETFLQIEALLGELHAFGKGSRIMVTTRNKQSLSRVDETYEPACLKHDAAQELFMKYAFRTNQPNGDYDRLSRRAIEYSKGLPLALKVLGASLHDKSVREWEALLDKLKNFPHINIQDVLGTCIDGLDGLEKHIFLDIACFFREWYKDFVTEFLDSCGFFARDGLRVLVDRALITIDDDDGTIDMHDLLQDMGREIVRQESPEEPEKRSRLWSYSDVTPVLTQNTATEAVKCLMLDLSNSEVELSIDTGAFVRMTKLRLLVIYYSFYSIFEEDLECEDFCPVDGCKLLLRGDFEVLSQELRFLLWHGCPLKSLPSTFIPKKLVKLDMRGSHIQQLWEGEEVKLPLQNLKVIMLSHCQYLVKIPDLTDAINLEKLYLDGCSSLSEVHSSIFALQNLHFLNLEGCKELKNLPSSIHMKSLKFLGLIGCSNLKTFPEISQVMNELQDLSLYGTAIKELPSSIINLKGLVTLNLRGCGEFKSLPGITHMESLEILDLSGCSNVEKFPEISEAMAKLKWIVLGGTAIKELPSSINNLTGLVELNLNGCTELKTLPTSIHMISLRTLNLNGCSNLEKFPEISGIMKELSELLLDETAIKGLPSSFDLLPGVKKLSMQNCKRLECLPDCICNLAELTHLDLTGCTELKTLPASIHMISLRTLNLNDCSNLEKFPEISEGMKKVDKLHLNGTAIKELPSSIERLQGLKSVSMRNCRSLVFLPYSICNLAQLTNLDLSGCSKLSCLPENFGSLESLLELDVQDSDVKQLPLSMSRLRGLKISLSCNGSNAIKTPFSAWSSSIVRTLPQHSCMPTNHLRHLDLSNSNLLEFPDGITHLSSLESLKLCSNDFQSLPATIDRLTRLTDLNLEDCNRLKSIPELPSSIKYIDAHDCTALESVSKPKQQYHTFHFFTFSNCSQLVKTNLFRDIVERHSRFQDNCLRSLRFNMSLPGSEVPNWFNHYSRGFSLSVPLQPNWFNSRFLGFAICAVRKYQGVHHYQSPLSAACFCTFKGNRREYSFSVDLLDSVFRSDRFLESDHMFLAYMPWSECPLIEEGSLVNETYYTEATFKIVVESEFRTEQLRITGCGVRFIYADQDEMLSRSVAQPQVHVDSCATGVSSMELYEMRNRETERAEITEALWEAESLESGEWKDTCHTLQLYPEQQIERKGEERDNGDDRAGGGGGLPGVKSCMLLLVIVSFVWVHVFKKERNR